MAFLRALRRTIPPVCSPAAGIFRRPPPPPPARRLLDPIELRSSAALPRLFSTSTSTSASMGSGLFSGLMDSRCPKRRPGLVNRRKRATLRPKGPYAWVQCREGEPIPASQPNAGSVRGRKAKKRIKQRKAFILSEKKKRQAQYSAAVIRKKAERTARKMAAVARERAWAERLKELKKLEEEKKAAATA